MAKLKDIKNVTLTADFQEVTVSSTLYFDEYIVKTNDQTDFEIKLLTDDTETFIHSVDDSTAPWINTASRKHSSDSTSLFFVKGTADSILQIEFIRY
jgi:hypothetical protein